MKVLLSTAAGILAAEAFCRKRRSNLRRVSTSSSSSCSSSTSSSSSLTSQSHHAQKPRLPHPSTRYSSTRSSPPSLEGSTTSICSSEQSEPEDSSSDSSSDSDTDSSWSTATHMRHIYPRHLSNSTTHPSQLPDHRKVMKKYISPAPSRSSDTSSDSSDSTSSTSQSSSSDDNDDNNETQSDSESDSLSSSSGSEISPTTLLAPHLARPSLPDPSTLHSRLSTFLPTIRASNAELERERSAGTLSKRDIETLSPPSTEGAEDTEPEYIEMDLGLGVLEEKGVDDSTSPVRIKRERSRESEVRRVAIAEGRDPLETLMGRWRGRTPEARERKRRKVGIQVLD